MPSIKVQGNRAQALPRTTLMAPEAWPAPSADQPGAEPAVNANSRLSSITPTSANMMPPVITLDTPGPAETPQLSSRASDEFRDIISWVDQKLVDDTRSARTTASPKDLQSLHMQANSFIGLVGVSPTDTHLESRERGRMLAAEREQSWRGDTFWGLDRQAEERAEAIRCLEMEDHLSWEIREDCKRQERHLRWEMLDKKRLAQAARETQEAEDRARASYLKQFYSSPSLDFMLAFHWPTRPSLPSDLAEVAIRRESAGNPTPLPTGGYTGADGRPLSPEEPRQPPLPTKSEQSRTSGGSRLLRSHSESVSRDDVEASGARRATFGTFHNMRSKKTLRVIPVPPHFSRGPLGGQAGKGKRRPGVKPSAQDGRTGPNSVSLSPLKTPRGGGHNSFSRARSGSWSPPSSPKSPKSPKSLNSRSPGGLRSRSPAGHKNHGAAQTFAAKFRAYQRRPEWAEAYRLAESGEPSTATVPPATCGSAKRRKFPEEREPTMLLDVEGEEMLLTRVFQLMDRRGAGRIRLDEMIFHMTENAQIKPLLMGTLLWTLVKRRQWACLRQLFDRQPGLSVDLPQLLQFNRQFYTEARVARRCLRWCAKDEADMACRRDGRAKRLLPVEYRVGQEVEALFMQGFVWYRAWVTEVHADDGSWSVRYTEPEEAAAHEDGDGRRSATPSSQSSPAAQSPQQSLTPPSPGQASGTEQDRHPWQDTLRRVNHLLREPPDQGQDEAEVVQEAFLRVLEDQNDGSEVLHPVALLAALQGPMLDDLKPSSPALRALQYAPRFAAALTALHPESSTGGLSLEEFCEFAAAITDLIEVNYPVLSHP